MSGAIKKIEQKCCVPQCKVRVTENTVFHKFPNDNKRKDEWRRSCNITKFITRDMLVCGSHFTKDDYHSLSHTGLRPLKFTAVPKLNVLNDFEEFDMVESNKPTSLSSKKRKCSIPQCNATQDEKTSFHHFPKQPNIRQQWVRACGVRVTVHPYACICSAHFARSDFITAPSSRKQVLKLDAVPTLNLPKRTVVKSDPQKVLTQDQSKIINQSKPIDDDDDDDDDNVTTIIYVPENCSNNIISTSGNVYNNSKLIIKKQDNLNIDNENVFCEVPDSTTTNSNNDTKTPSKSKPVQKVTIVKETSTKSLPNDKKPELKRSNPNPKNIVGQNKVAKQCNSNNNVKNPSNNVQLKNTIENSPVKKPAIRPGVSAVTLCADCGQYCKIEDEDLLYKSYKNSETLAAELLLELQEVTLSNEDEHTVLTKKGIEICNKAIEKENINLMELLTNDVELMAFTGINFELLDKLTEWISHVELISCLRYDTPTKNRIVLCLCKLRINLSFACLGMLFGLTQQSCASDFFTMLKTMSVVLDKTIYWPKTEELLKSLPSCFQSFKQTRVILNCSETEVEKQRCTNCQQKLLETNEKPRGIKLVLGVAPSGLIIFKSNTFESSSPNVSIFTQTNIMEKLDPAREAIMADKTLDIEAECAERNVTLIKLPKLGKKKQFSNQEVGLIKNISSARIHVDRTLHRFKMYKIMQSKIHWRVLPYLDEVCTVIAGIVNLKNPILPNQIDIKVIGPLRK